MMSPLTQSQSQTSAGKRLRVLCTLPPLHYCAHSCLPRVVLTLFQAHWSPYCSSGTPGMPSISPCSLLSAEHASVSWLSAWLTPSFRPFSNVPSSARPSLTTYLQGLSPLLPSAFSVLLPALFFSLILTTIWHTAELMYLFTFCLPLLECGLHGTEGYFGLVFSLLCYQSLGQDWTHNWYVIKCKIDC